MDSIPSGPRPPVSTPDGPSPTPACQGPTPRSHPEDPYVLNIASEGDFDALDSLLVEVFGGVYDPDFQRRERLRFAPERTYVISHQGWAVGTAGSYLADLAVPGATLPAALVTGVAVRDTHRRRGLLRRMMVRQLEDLRAGGVTPIAVLWASEGRIYQRFGYGLATRNTRLWVDSREVGIRGSAGLSGTLRSGEPEQVRADLEQVYQRVYPERPGWFSRSEAWWSALMIDSPLLRDGATPVRATLYEEEGRVDGYALWRVKASMGTEGGPAGEVIVVEVVAATSDAYAALWRHLLSIDLTRSVRAFYGAVNEPLVHLVDEPRRLRARVNDGLWLRVVDLPAALMGRRYSAPVRTVLEVTDEVMPANAGRWLLVVDGDGRATVERTTQPADLTCDIADLGAVYLGGTPLGRLVDAGRVREGTPGAARAADAALRWFRDPAALEMF